VSLKHYDKILLEPVSIWISADSDLSDLSDADRHAGVRQRGGATGGEAS